MKSLATNHAWEMESPERTWLSLLMYHQSTTAEMTIMDTSCPGVAMLNAQNDTCLMDAPYHPWSVAPPNCNNASPLTSWHVDHPHGPDASVNNATARDFEALYNQEYRHIPWTGVPNDTGIGQVSDTTGSSQGTNDFTYVPPLTPETSPPHLFQCLRPSTGKQSKETMCGRCFPDKRGLTRHERNVHTSDGYKCRCSARLITRKDNHRRHVKSCDRVADPQRPVYICRCGTPGSDKDGHLRHLKTCTHRSGGGGRLSGPGDVA
ncbi:hypothetical protein G7054_g2929 [Neopestalotiopsis clavispora]|nr:hypothetical protein G7054_g2929 [Neopestalotiopsis clavispora]